MKKPNWGNPLLYVFGTVSVIGVSVAFAAGSGDRSALEKNLEQWALNTEPQVRAMPTVSPSPDPSPDPSGSPSPDPSASPTPIISPGVSCQIYDKNLEITFAAPAAGPCDANKSDELVAAGQMLIAMAYEEYKKTLPPHCVAKISSVGCEVDAPESPQCDVDEDFFLYAALTGSGGLNECRNTVQGWEDMTYQWTRACGEGKVSCGGSHYIKYPESTTCAGVTGPGYGVNQTHYASRICCPVGNADVKSKVHCGASVVVLDAAR